MNLEQSAMEEILNFGEFSSLLNKSHSTNSTSKDENFSSADNERKDKGQDEDTEPKKDGKEKDTDTDGDTSRDKDNYSCQVGNGQDIV